MHGHQQEITKITEECMTWPTLAHINTIQRSQRKAYNSDGVLRGLQRLFGGRLSLADGLHDALVGLRCLHGVLGKVPNLLKQPATTSDHVTSLTQPE